MPLHGSIVALVTPFDEHGTLDEQALCALIDLHLRSGTAAIVLAGTTGESAALGVEERERLWTLAVEHVAGRVPVIAGTGAPGTRECLALSQRAAACGVDYLLVVTPYYLRTTQAGLDAHFRVLADADLPPQILYNVPSRTGVDLQVDTALSLMEHPQIVGIKEAVADAERIERLVQGSAGKWVLSGDDPSFVEAIGRGAHGVISVAANIVPTRIADLARTAAVDLDTARAEQHRLHDLYAALAFEPNPIPVKWMLHAQGWISPRLRLPLLPLSPALRGLCEQVALRAGAPRPESAAA